MMAFDLEVGLEEWVGLLWMNPELGIATGWELDEKHFGGNKAERIVWFVSHIEYLISNSEI